MTSQGPPPFAGQRIIFLALLLGMTMFIVVAGIVIQSNGGEGLSGDEPLEILDMASIAVGGTMAVTSFFVKSLLTKKIAEDEEISDLERKRLQFVSRLVPVAMLEGGCLFGTVAWLLNGNAVPPLVVALVCLSIAIAIVPFTDPDAGNPHSRDRG